MAYHFHLTPADIDGMAYDDWLIFRAGVDQLRREAREQPAGEG